MLRFVLIIVVYVSLSDTVVAKRKLRPLNTSAPMWNLELGNRPCPFGEFYSMSMSRYAFAAAAALSALLASSAAMAGTANAAFTLGVIVSTSCTASAGYVGLF